MKLRFPANNELVSVILKLAGETCNINCLYCYEKRKPYGHAAFLDPAMLARFLGHCGGRPLAIVLHGGEPMLVGKPRMRTLLQTLRRYDGPLSVELQTNGTLLNDAWLDFFDEIWPDIGIGISLDGDPVANANRVDFAGRPTAPRVAAALRLLERRGRTVGVISVVSRQLLGRGPAIIDYFRQFKAIRVVKFVPCLDFNVVSKKYRGPTGSAIGLLNPDGREMPGWATTPAEFSRFVTECVEYWRESGAFREFVLEPFFSVVRALAGKPTSYTSWSDRKDPFLVTLYPDGRIGSSDLQRMPDSMLGHVDDIVALDEILYMQGNPRFATELQGLLDVCSSCSYEPRCRGGDLHDRLRYVGTPWAEEYCEARKQLIDCVQRTTPECETERR